MKHRWRVYIKPFDEFGVYQTDWIDVTQDVDFSKMGSLAVDLDNTEYDIGVYRSSNFSLTLNNIKGKYSDVGGPTSIFHYKRSNSLCKVTWEIEEDGPWCGTAITDESYLSEETTVFTGLITDEGLTMEITDQKVTFPVLGRESVFQKATVPSSSLEVAGATFTVTIANPGVFTTAAPHGLSVGSPVYLSTTGSLPGGLVVGKNYYVSASSTNTFELSESKDGKSIQTTGSQSGTHSFVKLFGMTAKSVIFAALNQSLISNLLTVSLSNVNPTLNPTLDSTVSLRDKTVQEALNELLLATNSVLYISNDTVFVAPRTESAALKCTFYGQASEIGPENVQAIKKIKNGIARTFNYFTWADDPTATAQDESSVARYGIRKKEIDFAFLTSSVSRLAVTTSLKNEFFSPKQEFDLYTPLTYGTLALELLDKVNVDYPTVYYQTNDPFPICGTAICGEAVLPSALWAFTLSAVDYFKIIGRSIDTKTGLVMFKLRGV